MTARGLIFAAPASGTGKTLVTAGLARHLRRRGWRVATAKAGPDFIDPTFHALAAGKPCRNLDVWGMRRATLAGLIGELEAHADFVLCEGVMGLFDGTGPGAEAGSTAELALMTGWPVVLVVDARGQGASVAALLKGFAGHRPSVPLAAVIFNRVSSNRHAALLADATARHLPNLVCLGSLPADPGLALPSRHLGLVPASENRDAEAVIEHCAARIGTSVDVERLLRVALGSTLSAAGKAAPLAPLGERIAVARDEAFCFAYPTLLEGWRSQGAEVTFFSPLANEPPGADADAVYLPGGYPELWPDRLASAQVFMTGIRRAASEGAAIYGECGGYLVLGEALIVGEGQICPMAGLLPLVTSFAERRLCLGYRRATLRVDTNLGAAGARFRGHEFHYATVVRENSAEPLFSVLGAANEDLGSYGLRRRSVFGSFIHLIDRETAS
ncbi:MAG: cobyrinate a,c-diamide synthase [Alphaproteobacteria bacterium]|nr:cobyrinate a,c-diamide synthase [Alphaproteobacteria bacterium]